MYIFVKTQPIDAEATKERKAKGGENVGAFGRPKLIIKSQERKTTTC